ncbi:YggT family protein [Kibdelosporangium banguiense]|uniref:YggT family protein n=1 Tax=Kibdelosporangium banguiense TaxID=1365924 RepID=A0ABS4T792_9PSEU|nr:YggT family protein [Kibdelosporangium banguiense]MBP2320248.1 YggT family protein [Kibdelosporangium banguiense]
MSALGTLLGWILTLFIIVMIVRGILDWVAMASRSLGVMRARRVTHALTEPVIAPVRRVMRPVRMGSIGIDLAFSVVFIAAVILRAVVWSL